MNPRIILSAFIVAYGIPGLVRYIRDPAERSRAMLLASMFLLSCA